ncbi:YeeE/YedE family protein [Photobacterium sp. SDRW27]|uniref:YeeE/YedE thiosulfate transporter family protein n=1 Tax=Photobacterium obscurum TaxID=2829490 RepID=UPI0022447F87|nr:YeeE/YedE thiosulfate transporter family protein [Photobacterium obscurum]MCW8329366.1 YeeE/YedE family protein [Photobacterium obscurum]
MLSYLLPILLAGLVGSLAQKTGLCMVRGVQELLAKRSGFLAAILCCGFWFWLVIPSAIGDSVSITMSRYSASPLFGLGGFLFGLGAALNKGCSISTISKLSKGHFYMFSTVLGWMLGWSFLASIPVSFEYNTLSSINSPPITVSAVLFTLVALILFRIPQQRRPILLGIILFGIIASILTYQVPHWSPSQLLKDISAASIHGESEKWPSLQRYLIILGLVFGMAVSAKKRLPLNEFKLRPLQLILHLCAGVIMGIGASLALGGNDSQLLVALPSFSPAGAITIISMIVGISSGILVRKAIHRFTSKATKDIK